MTAVIAGALCACNGKSQADEAAYGVGFGARCAAWDQHEDLWPEAGPLDRTANWACKSWCYVDEGCRSAKPSMVVDSGLWYSYKGCEYDADLVEKCGDYDSCLECTGESQTAKKFGVGYGSKCKAWDDPKCARLWPDDVTNTKTCASGDDWCCAR